MHKHWRTADNIRRCFYFFAVAMDSADERRSRRTYKKRCTASLFIKNYVIESCLLCCYNQS